MSREYGLPCPFCGSRLELEPKNRFYTHPVAECPMSGDPFGYSRLLHWNKRFSLSPPDNADEGDYDMGESR